MTVLDLVPRVASADRLATLPGVIIGAGPVGLAAAANLAGRGIDFVILEAGDEVGSSIRRWGHTRLFSPWRHLIDPASRRLLTATGWSAPDDDAVPTGQQFVDDYLVPLARSEQIAPHIRLSSRVTAVSREGMDRIRTAGRAETPFLLRTRDEDGTGELTGRAIIDASGTFQTPNPLASSGLESPGVGLSADRMLPALPDVLGADRARFAGRHATVVGAGHSAANTLIALGELVKAEPATRVTWLIRNRSAERVTSSADDELADRARLGSRVEHLIETGIIDRVDSFEISRVEAHLGEVRLVGTRFGEPANHDTDVVVNATGFRPDLDMLREIRLELDEIVEAPRALAPLIDPNVHSCGTVEPHGFRELTHPEPGFFIVGMKSYGRAPTFLLATGYEQVRSVTAWLGGDMRAALTVQLSLPETGVCSTDVGSCCR